jgi:hypothetical protein
MRQTGSGAKNTQKANMKGHVIQFNPQHEGAMGWVKRKM